MKDSILLILDKILYVLMLIAILMEDSFSSFERCLLILIVGILLSLSDIKDKIKSRSITSK